MNDTSSPGKINGTVYNYKSTIIEKIVNLKVQCVFLLLHDILGRNKTKPFLAVPRLERYVSKPSVG